MPQQRRETLRLALRWPTPPSTVPETEFFCGVWHPHASLEVDLAVAKDALPVRVASGDNWWLAATELDFGDSARSLVQEGEGACDAFIFRGYLLEPSIHGWSEAAELRRQLTKGLPATPNGVFASARILGNGAQLELTTDLLGISPLYLRREDGLVLFSNSTRLLSMVGDAMDPIGARSLLGRALFGSHTLNERVQRLEPGVQWTIDAEGERRTQRPGLGSLSPASRRIDDAALQELEERWRQAMQRCLRIPTDDRLLLLSSGWDSRRILAALLAEKADFRAMSTDIRDRLGRDVDARFARELANRFGFRHEVIARAGPELLVAMDRDRRILLDSETQSHTWMLSLCGHLGSRGTLVFEGLAGDILSETGCKKAEPFRASRDRAVAQLAEMLAVPAFDTILRPDRWPSTAEAAAAISEWIFSLPESQDRELAFLLSHTRRKIAPATQCLLPAGLTAVNPYLDLDYLGFSCSLDPLDKLAQSTQLQCLERFSPDVAAVPGSRNVPDDVDRESSSVSAAVDQALLRARVLELREARRFAEFLDILRVRPRMQARLGMGLGAVDWWHAPISEALLCESLRVPAWRVLVDA